MQSNRILGWVLAALLLAARANAAIAVVQSVQASSDGSTTTISCPAMNTTAGNLISIFFRQSGSTTLPDSVANTGGDTFTGNGQADISGSGDDAVTHYYAENITGNAADVITVTWGSAQTFRAIVCYEISGALTSSALDQVVATRQSSASSITSDPFTTTQADEIILAGVGTGSLDATYTPDTGYTLDETVTSKDAAAESKVVSSIQTGVTTAMSATGSDVPTNWGIVVATFKAAGGGGGGTSHSRGDIF